MRSLAEAHNASSGRWVLMPRKGQRLRDSRERTRMRVRRRRRTVFIVLLEATALTLLMGAFPPLRPMLYGAGILGFLLLLYVAMLIKIRAYDGDAVAPVVPAAPPDRRFQAAQSAVMTTSRAAPRQRASNGHGPDARIRSDDLREGGVKIVEDDVHVVIRPAEQDERGAVGSLAR